MKKSYDILDYFSSKKDAEIHFLLTIFAILLFVPFLGRVHLFDWDEVNFAEAAREMLITGNYFQILINFEPFLEKPPLFFWLQAASMKIFGINEFAARFPNAVFGVLTLNTLYRVGKFWADKKTGILWSFAYAGTILPHFYFKTAIIDPVFNFFIFAGIFFLYRLLTEKKLIFALYAGLCIGFGILTKGPVAFMIPVISVSVFAYMRRKEISVSFLGTVIFFSVSAFVTSIWLLPEIIRGGMTFIEAFVQRHIDLLSTSDAGHGQPFFYHPVVLFFGCFPSSVVFLMAVFDKNTPINSQNGSGLLMKIMFWSVLIIFSVVKTKIVHYSSLTYFPLTYIAARYLLVKDFTARKSFWAYLQILSGAPLILASLLFPWVFAFAKEITPYLDDPFAAENLRLPGNWTGFEMLTGVFGVAVLAVIFRQLRKNDWLSGLLTAYAGMILFIQITLFVNVPKLEWHIQGALIEFLKEKSKEDCIVRTINFKSYAQFFYADVKPGLPEGANDGQKLLSEPFQKPVYIITKADRDEYRTHENLVLLYEKGGFIFYAKKK